MKFAKTSFYDKYDKLDGDVIEDSGRILSMYDCIIIPVFILLQRTHCRSCRDLGIQ